MSLPMRVRDPTCLSIRILINDSFGLVGSDDSDTSFFYLSILSYLCLMMVSAEHLILRELKTWRSYGIEGKGPIQDTLIKDIGDEHLLNIIRHLEEMEFHSRMLTPIYDIMYEEIAWRMYDCWVKIF